MGKALAELGLLLRLGTSLSHVEAPYVKSARLAAKERYNKPSRAKEEGSLEHNCSVGDTCRHVPAQHAVVHRLQIPAGRVNLTS